MIVLEAELWYMLFLTAKRKGQKTILLNARISEKSYPKYLKIKWFYKRIFKNIDKIYCQTEIDKDRLENLGAKNIIVFGNIKLAQKIKVTKKLKKPNKIVITAGSTHINEEKLILNNIDINLLKDKKAILFIAPRHPERFLEIEKLISIFSEENNLTYDKFSKNQAFQSDIILVDKLGELINIYNISDLVILGGAFAKKVGGHNPIEPAYFNCKIISGDNYFNQKYLFKMVDNIHISNDKNLDKIIKNTLENGKKSKINYKLKLDILIKEIDF